MKTQGQKTPADHIDDWEFYGHNAWAAGRPCDPASFTADPVLAEAWKRGWWRGMRANEATKQQQP